MQKVVFIISFLAIVFSGIAQDWTAIKFEKEEHNFGKIKEEMVWLVLNLILPMLGKIHL